jgi:hypothetical protein
MFFLGLSIFGFANFLDKYLMRYHEILPETSDILTLNPGETRPAPIAARPEDQNKALDLMSQITDLKQELKNLAILRDEMYYKTDKWLRDNQYRYESDTVKNFQKEIDDITHKHLATSEKIDSLSKDYTFLIKGDDDPDAGALRAYEHLKKHCSDFLNKSSQAQKLLYRGLQKYPSSFRGFSFIGRSWDERLTKDTPIQTHEKVSAAMRENGFTATRGNSIMCSNRISTALHYASSIDHVYLIVPFDGFKFTWSRRYKDMWSQFLCRYSGVDSLMGQFSNLEADEKNKSEMQHKIPTEQETSSKESEHQLIQYLKLDNHDLVSALYSGHEIYIHGKYYAFSYQFFTPLASLITGQG